MFKIPQSLISLGLACSIWTFVSGGAPLPTVQVSGVNLTEVPSGTLDGVNASFVLSHLPSPVENLAVHRNGVLLQISLDYTLSGKNLVFQSMAVPQSGDVLVCSYSVAVSIIKSAGDGQRTGIGQPFASTLQVTIKDDDQAPVQGATITFTAPSAGPGGTFTGGLLTGTGITDATGLAVSPTFTANSSPGIYNLGVADKAFAPTIFSLANLSLSAPTANSVTPSTGTGTRQNFTFNYSSGNGYSYLSSAMALINGGLNGLHSCFAYYGVASNVLYLYNDGGTALLGPITPGSSGTLSNSQCTIDGAVSSVSQSGNALALTLAIAFTSSPTGLQRLYGYAADNGNLNSGWQALGTWTLAPVVATPPVAAWGSLTMGGTTLLQAMQPADL